MRNLCAALCSIATPCWYAYCRFYRLFRFSTFRSFKERANFISTHSLKARWSARKVVRKALEYFVKIFSDCLSCKLHTEKCDFRKLGSLSSFSRLKLRLLLYPHHFHRGMPISLCMPKCDFLKTPQWTFVAMFRNLATWYKKLYTFFYNIRIL